jgi:hypothetical protein
MNKAGRIDLSRRAPMRWAVMAAAPLLSAWAPIAGPVPQSPARSIDQLAASAQLEPDDSLVSRLELQAPAGARSSSLEFPFLLGEIEGSSVSIGDTSHGRLVNGVELVESDALRILPEHRTRDLRYGTAPLIALLTHASRALGSATRTTLWLGNIGRKEGGDIEWSVSHNAGRDADVAFCYRDARNGKPVDPPGLVRLDEDGLSHDRRLAFDAARTWLVVRAMLEFEGASVQYLFISDFSTGEFDDILQLACCGPALPVNAVTGPRDFVFPDDDYPPMRLLAAPRAQTGATLDRLELRRLAVRAARHAGRMDPVEPLVALLDSDDLGLAVEASRTLASLTHARLPPGTERRGLRLRLKDAKARYTRMLVGLGRASR